MTRIIIWSIAICIFVTKSGSQKIHPDFYEQCSKELGIKVDIYDQQNKTSMLCLQKCVFEKDGTLNKKGVLKKSAPMKYLINSFFSNNKERIGFFNRCVNNLMPLGHVKDCWDIDKLIYCLVSNAEPFMGEGPFMLPPDMQNYQMPQMPQMSQVPQMPQMSQVPQMPQMSQVPGGILPPGWMHQAPLGSPRLADQ